MARLRVSYHEPSGRGRYHNFFKNFINDVEVKQGEDLWTAVCRTLMDDHGAVDVTLESVTMDIEFATERDVTLFLLRWS